MSSHIVRRTSTRSLLSLCAIAWAAPLIAASKALPWTPEVSIGMREIEPGSISLSPDGSKVFFLTTRGDLACDCYVQELVVFSAESVRSSSSLDKRKTSVPHPLQILTRKSSSRYDVLLSESAIAQASWQDDDTIAFSGADDQGNQQLFEFNANSGALRQVTRLPAGIGVDAVRRVKNSIVGDHLVPQPKSDAVYPAEIFGARDVRASIFSKMGTANPITLVSNNLRDQIEVKNSLAAGNDPYISPDGTRAIQVRGIRNEPESWAKYDNSAHFNSSAIEGQPDSLRNWQNMLTFTLIDLKNGHDRSILGTPTGVATLAGSTLVPMAFWSEDSRSAVLANTTLPAEGDGLRGSPDMSYLVAVDFETGKTSVLEPIATNSPNGLKKISNVSWITEGKKLRVDYDIQGQAAGIAVYNYGLGAWTRLEPARLDRSSVTTAGASRLLGGELEVAIEESANKPPIVVARKGTVSVPLIAPDPMLAGVLRSEVNTLSWDLPEGGKLTAGLLLPRGRKGPVPLVIQAYEFNPAKFRPDGPASHLYAGQALAGLGFAVLDIPIPSGPTAGVGDRFVRSIDLAVSDLAGKGLIDQSKVALLGFSAAGYNTFYAITHPGQTKLAAAISDDGFSGTFSESLSNSAFIGGAASFYGGTFWQDKTAWLAKDPMFNIDKVRTPVIFTEHASGVLTAVQLIGAFKANRRPFEYYYYPYARHPLTRPKERYFSQRLTIDWLRFWLRDELPADQRIAARWQKMKSDWIRQQSWEAANHRVGSRPDADSLRAAAASKY